MGFVNFFLPRKRAADFLRPAKPAYIATMSLLASSWLLTSISRYRYENKGTGIPPPSLPSPCSPDFNQSSEGLPQVLTVLVLNSWFADFATLSVYMGYTILSRLYTYVILDTYVYVRGSWRKYLIGKYLVWHIFKIISSLQSTTSPGENNVLQKTDVWVNFWQKTSIRTLGALQLFPTLKNVAKVYTLK